jgi:1-aminocyclopropane-1-carboxylate deaminase/D-cysteine desulfhydrase-like pyridoxal-dependent ACC family enzyme
LKKIKSYNKLTNFKLEDDTFQEIDEEVKEKKIKLIEKNGKNHGNTMQELYVVENIFLEDYAKVKDEKIEISEEINEDHIIERS